MMIPLYRVIFRRYRTVTGYIRVRRAAAQTVTFVRDLAGSLALSSTTFPVMEKKRLLVTTRQGTLQGVVERNVYGDEFAAFRGIPYAKPPVGELKFKDPVPWESWEGTRDASEFGACCLQKSIFTHEVEGSLDCLYLNVYMAANELTVKWPVMVYIHGGAFQSGSGDDTLFGCDYLIRKKIVLVTINYRVGIYGFLNLEHKVATGNQGLKDQVMALRWVHENIANFGGDPGNVTIFGESAGAASVHYLALSPMANGLFHKVIIQSGVATNPWASTIEPRRCAADLIKYLGKDITDPVEMMDFFCGVDLAKLTVAQEDFSSKLDYIHFASSKFCPSPDVESENPFLPEDVMTAMQSGIKVPVLIGYNEQESSFFSGRVNSGFAYVNENFETVLHPRTKNKLKDLGISPMDLKKWYLGDGVITQDSINRYLNLIDDVYFVRDIHQTINVQANNNYPTYVYKFTYDAPDYTMKRFIGKCQYPGATHFDEVMFLFCPYIRKYVEIKIPEPGTVAYKVMDRLTEMWTNFAKTGNPAPKKSKLIPVTWQPTKNDGYYTYMNIGEELRMERKPWGKQSFDWPIGKNKL